MSENIIDSMYIDSYYPVSNKLLKNYPILEQNFDVSLEMLYKGQVNKHDKYLDEVKIDFLSYLHKKYTNASKIINNIEHYAINKYTQNSEGSEFSKFINDSKSLISEISATKNDMSQPFSLYVIGAGKAGKSTLINALVGVEVATVGVLPKTWKVDRFFDDDTGKAVIHYKDGTPIDTISQITAVKLVEEEEKKRKDSEKNILKKRREHYLLYPNLTLEEKEGITRNLNDLYLYQSNIRQVEWAIDIKNTDNSILKKFSIIDTPGVGQNHSGKDKVNHVGEDITAFSQADGMLWVLDATTLAAATPEAILRDLEDSSVGITTNNKIAVLNRIDSIRDSMGEEGVRRTKLAAQKMLGNYFTTIIPFSAKEAFNAVVSNNKNDLHNSGYDEIFNSINDVFSKESTSRISKKADRLNNTLIYKYDRDLQPYINRLTVDEQLLKTTYDLLQKSLQSLKTDLENSKLNFLEEYRTNVELNIENYAASYLDVIEDSERNVFLSEYIFKTDDMQLKINKLFKNNQQYVSDFVRGQKKSDNKKFKRFKHLNEALYPMVIDIKDKKLSTLTMNASDVNFSSEDDASMLIGGGLAVAGMILLGPIGLLAGAADVLFGFSKGRKINAAKEKFRKHLMENIISPTSEKIDTVFQKLLKNAENEIKESIYQNFSQLHFEPTPENFKRIRQLIVELQKELNLPYENSKQVPDTAIRLKPSLTLYLLRQKYANQA